MKAEDYPFDGIIFDCNGTLVEDAKRDGRYVPRSEMCKWVAYFFGKLPLAVGSGGSREATVRALEDANIIELFDELVTVSDVANNKPAPDIFKEVSLRLKISPDRLLVIDDSDNGIRAAEQAGMQCQHISEADMYFRSIENLPIG